MSERPRASSTRTPVAPAGSPAGAAVCTACALVCTDLRTGECTRGDEALGLRRAAEAGGASIDGAATDAATALAAAAARLRAARRVLVTGLGGVTVEEAILACDLAEALGASLAIGAGMPPATDRSALARSGAITAAWEELRDRADLVLFWWHDPVTALPRFVDRFVAPPLPSGRSRTTVSIGSGPAAIPGSSVHRRLALPPTAGAGLARVLEARLVGRPLGPLPPELATAAGAILEAIDGARCVAIVTGDDAGGAERVAVTGLVRALGARLPAFEIPAAAVPPDAAGAEAVLAWRYGATGDVARAAPAALAPPGESPAPFDARAAHRRGDFDVVLALGVATDHGSPDPGSPDSAADLVTFRAGTGRFPSRGVQVRCRDLADAPGTIVRADGTTLTLAGGGTTGSPPTVGDLLRGLLDALSSVPGGSR